MRFRVFWGRICSEGGRQVLARFLHFPRPGGPEQRATLLEPMRLRIIGFGNLEFRVQGIRFRGFRLRIIGFGNLEFRVQGIRFRGFRLRTIGFGNLEFRVQGVSGFGVSGSGL